MPHVTIWKKYLSVTTQQERYYLFASHAATKQKRTGCILYMLQHKTTRVVYTYPLQKKTQNKNVSDTPVCVMK